MCSFFYLKNQKDFRNRISRITNALKANSQIGCRYNDPIEKITLEIEGSRNTEAILLGEFNSIQAPPIWGGDPKSIKFSFGGFSIGFLTYSYIKLGPRYPFLATVSRPFFRFSINNSFIPIVFIIYYCIRMAYFQINEELASTADVIIYIISTLSGISLFILLSLLYFFPISRNLNVILPVEPNSKNPISSLTNQKDKWYDYFRKDKRRKYYYLGKGWKIFQSRLVSHLHRDVVEQVFAKNRINAFFFELITIVAFVILGFLRDYKAFEVPAAMSIVMLLTIIHMLYSTITSWFNNWVWPMLIFVFFGMSIISVKQDLFRYTSYAFGLDYSSEDKIEYNVAHIKEACTDQSIMTESKEKYILLLDKWKSKQKNEKPKLVILNTSGGGSRSALWTFIVLDHCNKQTNGKLTQNLQMITGASGGMLGASYYRELLYRRNIGLIKENEITSYKKKLSKDLLNKLSFSASTNDLFMRFKTFKYNNHNYTRERGEAFEAHLHENTDGLIEHSLGFYQKPEQNAQIPVMLFAPTIVNDGRRLIMSSQNMSFLNEKKSVEGKAMYENIDYQTFFKGYKPQEIRFSSVIRANATFPVIMPMMSMPTVPEIQLMDAGIRDNHGGKLTIEYLFALNDWIKENTSGVIIVECRDNKRLINDDKFEQMSLAQKIFVPFLNMVYNFDRRQDYHQEQLLKLCKNSFDFPVDILTFNLRQKREERISLSWRLTKKEKKKIANMIHSKENQLVLDQLNQLLSQANK